MIAHRAYADVRGMTPGVAEITKDEIRITSAECGDKGNPTSDWQSLYIGRVKDGRVTQGDLCDGRTRSKTVPFPYTYFFTSKMNSIAQRVVLSIKVRWWLFGATESISSDGRVATLKFKDYTGPDRPAHPVKELRIVGSEARVQARY